VVQAEQPHEQFQMRWPLDSWSRDHPLSMAGSMAGSASRAPLPRIGIAYESRNHVDLDQCLRTLWRSRRDGGIREELAARIAWRACERGGLTPGVARLTRSSRIKACARPPRPRPHRRTARGLPLPEFRTIQVCPKDFPAMPRQSGGAAPATFVGGLTMSERVVDEGQSWASDIIGVLSGVGLYSVLIFLVTFLCLYVPA
jgi:hypothetical protein